MRVRWIPDQNLLVSLSMFIYSSKSEGGSLDQQAKHEKIELSDNILDSLAEFQKQVHGQKHMFWKVFVKPVFYHI